MIAYKLLRLRPDGSIGPLFINRKQRVPTGVWIDAEDHPTRGFAHRMGWHCSHQPQTPHLAMKLKSGEVRVWYRVEIRDYERLERPMSQGGVWYLAQKIKFLEPV